MLICGIKISKWRFKAMKAFFSFIALGLILGLVYAQHQPYKYIVSNMALEKAFYQDQTYDMAKGADGIWEWFATVTQSASENDMKNVEANCAYDIPLQTQVTIENETYTLYDPTPQDHACRNPQYPLNANKKAGVFISGNHEVLSFGMFQSRSVLKTSKPKSRGTLPGRPILTSDAQSLDPMTDSRVIEICYAPPPPSAAPTSTPTACLASDGFLGEYGSSLSWSGKYFPELTKPAYANSSEARYMKFPQHPFAEIPPCYSYDPGSGEIVDSPLTVTNCHLFWTTSGVSMRTECLLDRDTQPNAQFSFIAYSLNSPGVWKTSDSLMGCSVLISTPASRLHQYSTATSLAIQNYLINEDMYGTFFLTESNLKWNLFALFYAKQLKMHSFIDMNTRQLSVYAVLRNLGDNALFYALVKCSFAISISGVVSREFSVQYVPIIQYYYGLDGYPYIQNEVLVAELLFLIPFIITILGVFVWKIYMCMHPPGESEGIGQECHAPGLTAVDSTGAVVMPTALSGPPRLASSSSRQRILIPEDEYALSLDEEEEDDEDDDNSDHEEDSNDSDVIMRHSLQNIRNRNLSKKMETTSLNDIPLTDFSKILLPNVEELENMSSDSDTDSGVSLDRTSDDTDESANPIPLTVKKLKKHATTVTKQSKKTIKKNVKKIIGVQKRTMSKMEKFKKYFSLAVAVVFFVSCISRLSYIRYAREMQHFMTSDELTTSPAGSVSTGYDIAFEDIIQRFIVIERFEVVGRTFSIVLIFFFLVHFFSYLTFDKRFNLVTATLLKAVHDIVPMLIILLAVLFTYSVLGSTIYGHTLLDFAYVGSSMSSLLIIMLGEVTIYNDMKAVHPILTMLYFWTFVILAVFIIFNMVLALIFTLYDEEYHDMKTQEEQRRLMEATQAEERRRERISAIKRKKFIRRNRLSMQVPNRESTSSRNEIVQQQQQRKKSTHHEKDEAGRGGGGGGGGKGGGGGGAGGESLSEAI